MADDETKQLLRQILDYLPTLASKRDLEDVRTELRADIENAKTELRADIEGVRADLEAFKADMRVDSMELRGELKAINARLDEQRAVLIALIPTRIAAIPPAAE